MSRIQKALAAVFADRKELGLITQKKLAQAIGSSQPHVSGLLSGSKMLTDHWIEKICEALGVTLCDLEGPIERPAIPKEVREYAEKLKRLHEASLEPGFRSVVRSIDDWLSVFEPRFAAVPEPKPETVDEPEPSANVVEFPKPITLVNHDLPQPATFVKVPFYERIPAGDPVQLAFDQSFWMDIVHSSAKPGWWTTRVWGDSMLPEYRDGDIVLMDREQAPQNGNIVAALIDGSEATFKVFDREGDDVILTPLNKKKFKPRRFHASRVTIQGVLVELVRRAPPQRRSLRRRK